MKYTRYYCLFTPFNFNAMIIFVEQRVGDRSSDLRLAPCARVLFSRNAMQHR